ncbi:MAG: hemin receptor [Methylobacillus sp.]|jgi:hemoglobin-like flavoprotein|nr:hemin receptor [Methylobacillus sp.]
MTPQQITLVKRTWALAEPLGDTVTVLFYGRLFELDPALRRLFKKDMQAQGRSLRTMLGVVVNGLDKREKLVESLAASGRRHVNYGVKDQDYDAVRDALLWTLQQGLREVFTADARDAWAAVYRFMADTMNPSAATKSA